VSALNNSAGPPGSGAGRGPPDQTRLGQLAEEQAALRRVATLVAQATPPEAVFAAVAEEVGQLLPVNAATMARYESDGTLTFVAHWGRAVARFPVGTRRTLGGRNLGTLVFETGRPARLDQYADSSSGALGVVVREAALRSAVGTPIIVDGRLWGLIAAGSSLEQPLPPDTETRLASFTELVATAIANTQARMELRGFAEEQAALRRVATLVAAGAPPEEAFAAVADEAGRLFLVDVANLYRYESDGTATIVASAGWSLAVGTRLKLEGKNGTTLVHQTGRAARMESFDDASGPLGAEARKRGLRSAVGTPVMVQGRLWGMLGVGMSTSTELPLPLDTEVRLASFAELVATAIANAESHAALTLLAEEQAALRRVATLVARGVPPIEVFSAVSDEVARLFRAQAGVVRFERDSPAVVFVGVSKTLDLPVGTRWEFQPGMASAEVYRTGRSARVEAMDWSSASGPVAETARRVNVVSSVASPVVVEGRLWGAMNAASADERLPPGMDERLEKFTELLATAIANAESRSELAASRRRIVAASDEARCRIERDLHDGTQQRLVSLGLAARVAEADEAADRSELRAHLSRIAAGLADAVAELQELSRGIHPAVLSDRGLGPALRTLARRSAVPVDLDVSTNARCPEPIEVAAYYVASEALANAMKHARASRIEVSLTMLNGSLLLSIRDDGVGGADPARGSGLVGLTDRVEALGGSIGVYSAAGAGTHITVDLPL
jgi:signal transduction histidine kinase